MTRDFVDYLADMLAYAEKARRFVGAMTPEELLADEKTYLATVRAIEIVGEAARHVPDDFRARFPAIPWRQMVAMRNILAHNYEGADPRIVHRTATVNLADLITLLPEAIEAAKAG
ncbi:MAG: DUF86 domain-containing protein [Magnetospirillum sp.]|nr:DUF86 domain-containing protein [Alphaproteobacteria bacterium]MBI5165990.1 DUF86 domain-containing protein [Magnetospirillum sp.]